MRSFSQQNPQNHEIHGGRREKYNRGRAKESLQGRAEKHSCKSPSHFKDGEGGGSEKVSGFPNSTRGLLAEAGLQSGPTSFFKVLCSILPSLETKGGRESWEVMQTMEQGGRSERVGSTLHQDVITVLLTKAFFSKAVLPLMGMHVSECTFTGLVNTSQHTMRHVKHWASCLCTYPWVCRSPCVQMDVQQNGGMYSVWVSLCNCEVIYACIYLYKMWVPS